MGSFHWQVACDDLITFVVEPTPCQLSIKFSDLDGALEKIVFMILFLARVSIHQAGHPLSGITCVEYPETLRCRFADVVDHEALGGVSDLVSSVLARC